MVPEVVMAVPEPLSAAGVMLVTVPVPPPPAEGAQYVTVESSIVMPTFWATFVSVTRTSATAGRLAPIWMVAS